jgi:hypothetical protein
MLAQVLLIQRLVVQVVQVLHHPSREHPSITQVVVVDHLLVQVEPLLGLLVELVVVVLVVVLFLVHHLLVHLELQIQAEEVEEVVLILQTITIKMAVLVDQVLLLLHTQTHSLQ